MSSNAIPRVSIASQRLSPQTAEHRIRIDPGGIVVPKVGRTTSGLNGKQNQNQVRGILNGYEGGTVVHSW